MAQQSLEQDVYYSSMGDDADLSEIVRMFVDEMPDRIKKLNSCYEADDQEGLGRAAHQLKGAAGSYGFDQITPYAGCLESAVRENHSDDEVKQALDALVGACEKVRAGVSA